MHNTTRDSRTTRLKAPGPGMIFMEQSYPHPQPGPCTPRLLHEKGKLLFCSCALFWSLDYGSFQLIFSMSMSNPSEKETVWLETLLEKYILLYTFQLFVSCTCIPQLLKIHWSNYSFVNAFVSLLNYTKNNVISIEHVFSSWLRERPCVGSQAFNNLASTTNLSRCFEQSLRTRTTIMYDDNCKNNCSLSTHGFIGTQNFLRCHLPSAPIKSVTFSLSLPVLLRVPLSVHSTNIYNAHLQPDHRVDAKGGR